MRRLRGTRTPSILQLEAAECGAASLAIVLGYWGRHAPLEQLRRLCGVSRDGAKASSIVKAGREFGMTAKGLKAEPEHLPAIRGPSIAFVNFNHFIVVEKATRSRVWVNDPAVGRRRMSIAEFSDAFTGVLLTFEPGEDFERLDERPSLAQALWRRLEGFRTALLFVFLVNLALVIPGIAVPVFSRIFVDYGLVRGLDAWIGPILIGMGATAAVRFVLLELQAQAQIRLTEALTMKTGAELFWRLLRLPVSFFDQRFAGEVTDRIRLNENLAELLTGRLAAAMIAAVTSVFFAAAMALYHPGLALAVVLLSLLNLVVLRVTTRALSETHRKVSIDEGKLMGARISALRDIETFKASGAEDIVFARWAGLETNVVNGRQEAGRIAAWAAPAPGLVSALIAAVVLIGGGWLVMRGQMTLGTLVAFQSLSASFSGPIARLAGFGAELQELRSFTQRLEDVLEQPLDAAFAKPESAMDRLPSGEIRLESVRFGYAPLDPPLIDGLSLTIAPGRRVALVGASGSGKSTVGKLIAGLEVPQSGAVLIDGAAPSDWPREALARRFAYVQQDTALFEGSLRENLTLWDDRIEDGAVTAAAHDAAAHEVIAARPGGYEAILSEGGANFSGGERQRLEIARALSRDPAVIVLDEATSALDPISEKAVMDAIRRRGATSIIIAHRLSTIRDCDEIIVLDHGVPVERGRHADLMAAGGAYSRLVEA